MSAATALLADPELQSAEWDLSDLVDGEGEGAVERQLSRALELAEEFATKYAAGLAELDSSQLADAMRQLETMHDLAGRAGSYAALRFATDTADPERGALLQMVQERETEIETKLLFFELEWAALDDEHVERLLSSDELAFCAHYLRSIRRYRPHLLSEPEEKILAEKAISSQAAWGRLFGELTSALTVPLDGEEVKLEVALSRLQAPDREVRRTAAEAVSHALEPGIRTRVVHLQHACARQGRRGPSAPLSPLAREPQSGQRSLRRVGDGAHRSGASPLRHTAALVRAEGQAPRSAAPRRL